MIGTSPSATDKLVALKRLAEAWGPSCDDGRLIAWAAAEIERLTRELYDARRHRDILERERLATLAGPVHQPGDES